MKKLTKDLEVFNRAADSFPTELLLIVKKEVFFAKNFYRNEFEGIFLVLIISILGSAKFEEVNLSVSRWTNCPGILPNMPFCE